MVGLTSRSFLELAIGIARGFIASGARDVMLKDAVALAKFTRAT
jgi:hypothetical protein